MKLNIRLIDGKENALKNAVLSIKLVFKDGTERRLPSRKSNGRGEIAAVNFAKKIFQLIDFEKSSYQITLGDQLTPWLTLGGPTRVSREQFRYILVAQKLGSGDSEETESRSRVQLIAILEADDGKRLAGSSVYAIFSSVDGKEYKLGPVEADKEDRAYFQLPINPKDVDWASPKFRAELDGVTYLTVKSGEPDESGEAWFIVSVLKAKKQPQPGPENQTDNTGWSTGPEDSGWVVQGVVAGEGGEPQNGIQVKAYDKTIGDLITLGGATTAAQGRYRIYYLPADERKAPNLLVKVFKGNKQLATSGLITKAGPSERVDFSLSDETFAGVPLYTQLLNDTEPFLEGKSPTALDVEDVALLAEETNQNSIVLAHFVRAWDLIELLKQPAKYEALAEPFFALTAGGLHPTLDGVLGTGDEKIRTLLKEAFESRWISKIAIEDTIRLINELRTQYYKDGDSDLSKLLDAVGVAKTKKGPVIAITLSEQGEEQKWGDIQGIVGAQKTNKLRDLIAIWQTLEKDATIAIYLYENHSVSNIAKLVVVDRSTLLEAVKAGNEMPDEIQGKTNNERQRNYRDALFDIIEKRNPHLHFLHNLKQSNVDTAQDRASRLLAKLEINLEQAESLRALANDEGLSDLADLATLYVICPLPGRAVHAEQLMAENILSSMDVIDRTKDRFREAMLPQMQQAISNQIYDKSAHLGSMTTALSIQLPPNDPDKKTTLVSQLFGDSLNNNCEHCTSTFSPSAYLLDLYRFLKRAEYGADTGIALLDERRPDIKDLDLNCANSDTLMPYIDLTNEVLESMVTDQPLSAEQTSWEPERLRAEPQHINPVAYELLAEQTFPWTMGYGRELKRTQAYLTHLGIDFARLSQVVTINRSNAERINQGFAHIFGVVNPQAIAYTQQPKWLANWGVSNRISLEQLPGQNTGQRKLGDLSQWLHLDATKIVELCNTGFVNADLGTFDSLGNIDWSLLDDETLRKLQFFGRLHLQTGYSAGLLDRLFALEVFDATKPLVWRENLSAIEQLSRLLKTPADELLLLWEQDANIRRAVLAEEFGLSDDLYATLEEAVQQTSDTPAGLLHITHLVADLARHDLDLEDAICLLSVAAAGHNFSYESNLSLLDQLQTAMAETADEAQEGLPPAIAALVDRLSEAWAVSSSTILLTSAQQQDFLAQLSEASDENNNDLVDGLIKMSKLAWLQEKLAFSEEDLSTVIETAANMAWLDPSNLPSRQADSAASLIELINLAEHQRVNQLYFSTENSLFVSLKGNQSLVQALSADQGLWSEQSLSYLLGADALNFSSKNDFINKGGFLALSQLLEVLQSTGGSAEQVWSAIRGHDASEAQDLLQLSVPENDYWDLLRQLNDPIREDCRQRLVETALTQSRNKGKKLGFQNTHELYEHVLIDPEMSACFDTSRTKQAIAGLQQLIQRIMLNLETDCSFNSQDIEQWAWRKNYRVWEANRKVFLTPENWVEPELRDNKSELFVELETELLQGEVDAERAEKTLLNYARGLLSLSRMEMVASLQDVEANRHYVFARSSDHPRKYYWCKRDSNGLWDGWQAIEQEIEGDHLLPVIFQNRIFLFWLNLAEKVNISHRRYKERLAAIEADEEICRDEINEKSRLIQDYIDAIDKYESYARDNYAGMGFMWSHVVDNLEGRKSEAEELLIDLKHDLVSLKSQKDALALSYTYFECSLSWSQFDPTTGWAAGRRSVDSVNTIYEREGEDEDTHLRHSTSIWLLAKPNLNDLDIELRTSAGNANGKSYAYRLGLFEFDPVLEQIAAKDERQAPQFEIPYHFSSMFPKGQYYGSIHPLPWLKLDIEGQDQTLVSWDSNVGARVYPERILGYNPNYSPFLFGHKNRSYFFEPTNKSLSKPLVNVADVPKVPANQTRELLRAANTNFQALSLIHGSQILDTTISSVFANVGMRTAATPVGRSDGKLADGRPSSDLSLNTTPATSKDWAGIESVMRPEVAPVTQAVGKLSESNKWNVSVLYHPFADIIVEELYRGGIDALYRPDADSGHSNAIALKRQSIQRGLFNSELAPTSLVELNEENEERFEFNRRHAYSVYNWEIFFHAPFAIAKQLTRNRKYEDAQKWLHYIFDPVSKDNTSNRSSWRFRPFFDEHLRLLDGSQDEITEFAEQNFGEFEAQVAEWEQNPFNPHAIARLRNVSYMRATFIAYIDNLLAWADDLFRRDTMESVAEAAQLYIHAAQIIGPAPVAMPKAGLRSNSRTLQEHDEGKEQVHPLLVASGVNLPPAKPDQNDFYTEMGAFCIPANDRIEEYWNTVADRLFKIRHCMNIEGVERTLALYQPPIDPAMLVKAAAAGVDIGAAISGMSAPLPHYRFNYMLQKAKEFAGEVRSLGGALLSALEKQDAEELSQLRSNHELGMQKRILEIKKERLKETQEAHASIEKGLFAAMDRRDYYQDLINEGNLFQEDLETALLMGANLYSTRAEVTNAVASTLFAFPQLGVVGFQPQVEVGGVNMGHLTQAMGNTYQAVGGLLNRTAGLLARDASNVRREMEWQFQVDQAKREIERIEKDQLASEIRMAIAEKEIADQEQQIANSEEADLFLRDKFTNAQLYGWMVSQLSALHYQAYQLALSMAKQAEACLNFELDDAPASIIEFSYWDGMKKGLLSGERLIHDLNRLDAHYIANNDRKLELSKHVSLHRVDANSLIELKRSGTCEFSIPEYIFDLDYPDHVNRRIKSVSLTIPAVSGPYTTLSCELSLSAEGSQADSIALSSAQNDSGLFQFDLRDERYLPFEGRPVTGLWKLELPPTSIAQFDYSTISDVILTINYTARSDASRREQRISELESANFSNSEFVQLLSMRTHFSDIWHQLSNAGEEGDPSPVNLTFVPHHFPYIAAARGISLSSCAMVVQEKTGTLREVEPMLEFSGLTLDSEIGIEVQEAAVLQTLALARDFKDIFILVSYSIGRA